MQNSVHGEGSSQGRRFKIIPRIACLRDSVPTVANAALRRPDVSCLSEQDMQQQFSVAQKGGQRKCAKSVVEMVLGTIM